MQWRPFLLVNFFAAILVASWFFEPTASLWKAFDEWAFHALNDGLKGRPLTQIFWALANVKITDLFGALFIIIFSLLYVFDEGKKHASQRLAQIIYYLIWFELGILCLKEVLFHALVACNFLRDSPTLQITDTILLSKAVPWLKIKDSSRWCFPSDHAFIIFQWAGFICFYCGWRLGALAFISSTFFILPRLIGGAHWLSDVLVGSLPIALIFVSLACFTPIYSFTMRYLKRLTSFITNKFTMEFFNGQNYQKCQL